MVRQHRFLFTEALPHVILYTCISEISFLNDQNRFVSNVIKCLFEVPFNLIREDIEGVNWGAKN